MRLFIGTFVQIPEFVSLKNSFSFLEAKWTKRSNLHITWLFLGKADPKAIIEALHGIDYQKDPIPIKGLGFFGSPPKILYAKAGSTRLSKLHDDICKRLDFEDDRPFIPHITLARIKKIKDQDRFIKQIRRFEHKSLGLLIPKIELINSTLTPQGPIYERIATF